MYPSVKEILELEELKECHVLTGSGGLSNRVTSVTIMDNPEITKWLNGGEILLTNGYIIKDYDEKTLLNFFDSLKSKKIAAVFIKLKRYIDRVAEPIIEYANKEHFPIVEVPYGYNWLQITNPINKYIIENQYYLVEKSIEIRNQLLKLAVKERSIEHLCLKGSKLLSKPISVFDENFVCIAGSNEIDWKEVEPFVNVHSLLKSKTPDFGVEKYDQYILNCKVGQFVFVPITYDFRTWGYIGIKINQDKLTITWEDSFMLEQMSLFFIFELIKEKELRLVTQRYISDFLLELIEGVLSDKKEIIERSSRLNKKIQEKYRVVAFSFPYDINPNNLINKLVDKFYGKGSLTDIFACVKEKHIVLFLPQNLNRDDLEQIEQIVEFNTNNKKIFLGVSSVHDITEMKKAYQEALFALSVKNYTNKKNIYYENLGLIRFFGEDERRIDLQFIKKYYEENFRPLADYDKEFGTNLIETLECFLDNYMSIPQTAKKIFIHENTLRARIKRIEKILNRNLKKPYDLFSMILGLIIHYFINKCGKENKMERGI